jgi:hypothetical protein
MDEFYECLEFCAFLGRSERAGGRQLIAPPAEQESILAVVDIQCTTTWTTTELALSVSFVTDVQLSRNEETKEYCYVADNALTVLEGGSINLPNLTFGHNDTY